MRWLSNFYDFRFKLTATAKIGIHPSKAWLSQLVNLKKQPGREDTLEGRYARKFGFKLGKNARETYRMLQTALDNLAWSEHQFLRGIRYSRKAGSLWRMMRDVGEIRKSIHLGWLAKGLRLGLLCWGFKGVQEGVPSEEGQHSSNRVSGISTRTMHQSSTPFLSQTIWPRWASRQFLSLPRVQNMLPVTFGYSLSSEAVVMRQLRRWKRLWRRSLTRSHKRTSIGPPRRCWNDTISALHPEEFTSKGTRVLCVYYQEKCPYGKSLETYLMILIYIYIYIYIWS